MGSMLICLGVGLGLVFALVTKALVSLMFLFEFFYLKTDPAALSAVIHCRYSGAL